MIGRLVVFLASLAVASASLGSSPGTIDGLEAWYRIETLHVKMRKGDVVSEWQDSSGNDHHLISDDNGPRAEFHTLQVNGQPAIHLKKLNTFSVQQPFTLQDHTIFVVYSAQCLQCALFHAPGNAGSGLILRGDGVRDFISFQTASYPYNRDMRIGREFQIAVFARENGTLRSFLNGADVSTGIEFTEPVGVGKFFHVSLTRAAKRDGNGLRLAEMAFFDRYLSDDERNEFTQYLAQKFGIQVTLESADANAEASAKLPRRPPPRESEAHAVLGTETKDNVNAAEPYAIPWTLQSKAGAPLRHQPDSDNTRLYCDRDGTRVRLYVSLPLIPAEAGGVVRVLVMKNYEEYLPDEADSGPMSSGPSLVELDVSLDMQSGDFVEVITVSGGADGTVTLGAGAVLIATVEEPAP